MENLIDQLIEQISASLDHLPDIDLDCYADTLGDDLHQHITSFCDLPDEIRDSLISTLSAALNIPPEQVAESMDTVDTLCSHDFCQTIPFAGNSRDENVPKFFAKCTEYGIFFNESFDRDPGGGIQYGQKNGILLKIKDAKDGGKITQEQFDELSSLFYQS